MKSYNGFTSAERTAAGAWLRKRWASGEIPRPAECCACGQTEGVLDAHAEDYSKPYGEHLTRFPMCFWCHMMLHSRWRFAGAWLIYRQLVAAGGRLPPCFTRSLPRVAAWCAAVEARPSDRGGDPERVTWRPAPERRVLDEIHAGQHDPRRRELPGQQRLGLSG